MKNVAFYFFTAAVLCAAAGMIWGVQMSVSRDHSLSMAHAHLSLVGWTTLGLFGLYYTVTPDADGTVLSRTHLAIALAGVVSLVPGIALVLTGGTPLLAVAGSILTVTSMLIFLVTVTRNGIGRKPA